MPNTVSGTTRLGGLLGSPVSHSLSPAMYNDSFSYLHMDCIYLCFDVGVDGLKEAVAGLRRMNVFGFNLTMPDKQAVIPLLDDLSEAARLIGAVNTVENRDGRLIGHNTDGVGYMRTLEEAGVNIKGREMVLIGAGGAGSAIAVQAALDGAAAVHLAVRQGKSRPRAEALADTINTNTACRAQVVDINDPDAMRRALDASVLLTNASSAGMNPNPEVCPLPDLSLLRPGLIVSDIIYNPRVTRLLAEAEKRGLKTVSGLHMLLYQGEEAFKIRTGRGMPVSLIRERYF